MLDQNNPEAWLEIPYQQTGAAAPAQAVPRNSPPVEHAMAYAPCRCWRCRGGVALADRPTLDRLLAKHLMTLSAPARGQWLLMWAGHPRHDADAREQLKTWVRIAGGSGEAEPEYSVYSMPEDA
ncbi:hypothetical protein CEY09_14600 [Achromobacter marplatensis]|uniref:Uncharacterized protein n=1 Tax=Achromobacter marplatensis TaxID=470868 RepID=A0ABX9GD18_9BURK|nr:hypothetical protein [Achromobacter marplatensis]OWT67730.1 hypothetical protein CEY09_14600 [Achromobacter marplatensis]RBP19798.1 hypothetical protein DFP87_104133 [Achromobacter marplatensis]CAB3637029.1 hypothetical protein LMG26219_01755 [Achromobacter marplatensis]